MIPSAVRCSITQLLAPCNALATAALTAAAATAHCSTAAAAAALPTNQEIRAAYEHCAQQVKQHDPDNFLWVVQLPQELRLKVLALRAFNLETLLIAEQVKSREQLLMQIRRFADLDALDAIRYQWWRDALTSLSENVAPAKHPVLTALWHVNTSRKISKYQLKRLLDTREADALHHQTPLTVQELEGYAEGSASQLLYLQLAAAGVVSREADHAASHLGKAIGISLLLRGTPYQASKRRSYLPVELCVQHGVSQEDVYRGVVSEGIRDVTLAVASVAMGHLQEARRLAGKLPPAAPQVLLQAVLAGQYLKALEKAGFNPFDFHLSSGGSSPLRTILALKWNILWRTY